MVIKMAMPQDEISEKKKNTYYSKTQTHIKNNAKLLQIILVRSVAISCILS
jgi:hypothetical protein